jgi:23S rRNA pseudouridine2605 synthase
MTTKSERRSPAEPTRRGPGKGQASGEGLERLQKTLARAGLGSRRSAEDLIKEGRVRVDRHVAHLGDRVDPAAARITVDGVPIPAHPELRYFALNKPVGVTTTLRDPHAERSVAEFVPDGPRVFPVGRLDRESEGLVLLTNDGELANRLQHPRFGVEKEYLVEVEGAVSRGAIRTLRGGIELEDGVARALHAEEAQRGAGKTALTVVMGEGRKREIRRMMEALGHPVRRLVRVRIGPVRIGRLRPGHVRSLTADEIAGLYRVSDLDRAVPRPGQRSGQPRSSRAQGSSRSRESGRRMTRRDST